MKRKLLLIAGALVFCSGLASADVFEVSYNQPNGSGGFNINTTLYVNAVDQGACAFGTCYLIESLAAGYPSTGYDLQAYPGTGTFTVGGIVPANQTNGDWSDNYAGNIIDIFHGVATFNPNDPNSGFLYTDTTPLPGTGTPGVPNAYVVYTAGGGQSYEYQFAQSNQTGIGSPVNLTITEVTATPEGGTTLALLGLAVAGLAGLRRKLSV